MFNSDLPKSLKNLLFKCLKKNPKERADITQIAKDAWVTKNGAEPLLLDSEPFPSVFEEDINAAIVGVDKQKPAL